MSKSNEKSPLVKNVQNNELLAEHATAIRTLGERVKTDVIEIGRHLTQAKAIVGHGRWLPWLEHEFKWHENTATISCGFMNSRSNPQLLWIWICRCAPSTCSPSTPPEAIKAVIDKAAGEKLDGAKVKEVIHKAKAAKKQSSPRLPGSRTQKRSGVDARRHDERMKSVRYKLEAFIRDYFDMAEWKELCEAIKKQLGAKHA